MPWLDPSLSLRWGAYSKLDADEQQKLVDLAVKAKDSGIATTRMAVEKVAGVFGIENVDAVMDAIEEEATKKAAKDLEQTTAEQQAMHDIVNDADPGGNRGGSQKKPPGASSGGSRGAGGSVSGAK